MAETQLKLAVAKEKAFVGSLNCDVPGQVGASRGWIKPHGMRSGYSRSISVRASCSGKVSPNGSTDRAGQLPRYPCLSAGPATDTSSGHRPVCHWTAWITCPSLHRPCGWGWGQAELPALTVGRKGSAGGRAAGAGSESGGRVAGRAGSRGSGRRLRRPTPYETEFWNAGRGAVGGTVPGLTPRAVTRAGNSVLRSPAQEGPADRPRVSPDRRRGWW